MEFIRGFLLLVSRETPKGTGHTMDPMIRNILIGVAVFVILKFILSGHIDKNEDLAGLLKEGALLVDVRTPREFSNGHIKNAVNIPYDSITAGIKKKAKKKDKPIILYCHSAARAGVAKKMLVKAGYTRVINAGSLHRIHRILGQ